MYIIFGILPSTTESVHEYLATFQRQMEKPYNLARHHSLSLNNRVTVYYRKVHGTPYEQGEFVWLNTPKGR